MLSTRWSVARTTLSVVAAIVFMLTAYYMTMQRPAEVQIPPYDSDSGTGRVVALVKENSQSGSSSTSSSSLSGDGAAGAGAQDQSAAGASQAAGAIAVPSPALTTIRRPPITMVCISDTHGLFQEEGLIQVPQGDMILFPGDVAVGTPAEGLAFSAWLEQLPVRGPKVLTWGNMDTATPHMKDPVPAAIVLVNTIQEVNGYRIFGSPFTPHFAGAYQLDLDQDESFAYWTKLLPPNSDVDIIMTHGPPYGFADKTGGRHRGDMGLLRAVQALQQAPLLWVCGHIHEQYGEHRVPHARAPGGHVPLINSAVYYVQQPEHRQSAQPRAVRMPEVEVLPRG